MTTPLLKFPYAFLLTTSPASPLSYANVKEPLLIELFTALAPLLPVIPSGAETYFIFLFRLYILI
jgi:hypothetical protein